MYSVSIDGNPDSPVGTPDGRKTLAIHWYWTTDYSIERIATALGVTEQTVEKYLHSSTESQEVKEQMANVEANARFVAVEELRDQLKRAGHRSKTAETPTEVWRDDNGDIRVHDVTDDNGDVVERFPVPDDIQMLPDQEARYYARSEVRSILEQLCDILGIGEPDRLEVTGDVSGSVEVNISHSRVPPNDSDE